MTNNKQQTAVDWLVCQLQQTRDWQRVINEANQSTTSVRNVLQQAKEMEKEQMKDCMSAAFLDGLRSGDENYKAPYEDWEQYYNETYGGGEQ
jgi:hypothetical protein